MKTKTAFVAAVLIFGMIRMFGHGLPEQSGPLQVKTNNPKPPTFETKTAGLEIKVWIMTWEEHQKMMEGMKKTDNTMKGEDKSGMTKMANDGKMTGSYHMKMVVNDAENGMVRNGLDVKVQITSPSEKMSTAGLKNMSDHYGSDIMLSEKGSYTLMINIDDKGVRKTAQFNYVVQ